MNPFPNLRRIAQTTTTDFRTLRPAEAAQRCHRTRAQIVFSHQPIRRAVACLLMLLFTQLRAQASIFQGETLDKVADVLTWVVLIIAPIVGIVVFLLIHILPEKIAEKKQHPQTKAIQCLCLLSLVFGGMLWPLAWLWAYSKPVFHKMAYGHDRVDHEGAPVELEPAEVDQELKQLWARVHELEAKQATHPAEKGKG